MNSIYEQLQVQYNQGLVKTFLVSNEMRVGDAVTAIRSFGRFRAVRMLGGVDRPTADLLANSGNATVLETEVARG